MPCVEQVLTHQRAAEVGVRLLYQQKVPELRPVTQIGKIVSRAPFAFGFGGKAEPKLSLANQVERGVGERNVLFQSR